MSALYSSKHIIRVLESHGFYFVSQRGSHAKYRNDKTPARTVIVPNPKKEIPHGTFRSIVIQSGLTESDFKN